MARRAPLRAVHGGTPAAGLARFRMHLLLPHGIPYPSMQTADKASLELFPEPPPGVSLAEAAVQARVPGQEGARAGGPAGRCWPWLPLPSLLTVLSCRTARPPENHVSGLRDRRRRAAGAAAREPHPHRAQDHRWPGARCSAAAPWACAWFVRAATPKRRASAGPAQHRRGGTAACDCAGPEGQRPPAACLLTSPFLSAPPQDHLCIAHSSCSLAPTVLYIPLLTSPRNRSTCTSPGALRPPPAAATRRARWAAPCRRCNASLRGRCVAAAGPASTPTHVLPASRPRRSSRLALVLPAEAWAPTCPAAGPAPRSSARTWLRRRQHGGPYEAQPPAPLSRTAATRLQVKRKNLAVAAARRGVVYALGCSARSDQWDARKEELFQQVVSSFRLYN